MCLGLGFLAALVVPEGANPDEWNHLGALRWFETHWTAPELGSPEVFYDGYGLSRVRRELGARHAATDR